MKSNGLYRFLWNCTAKKVIVLSLMVIAIVPMALYGEAQLNEHGLLEFQDGEPILADEVNQNFETVVTRIDSFGVPTGAVMFFNLTSCPNGWSELELGRGRYLVGMSNGGTLGLTAGTPLIDGENRPVGQHTHSAMMSPSGEHQHSVPSCCGSHWDWGYDKKLDYMEYDYVHTTAGGAHVHDVNIGSSGSVAGTNAPYIQFLLCEKD